MYESSTSQQSNNENYNYNPIFSKPYVDTTIKPKKPQSKLEGFETKAQKTIAARKEDLDYLKSKGFSVKQPSLFSRAKESTGNFLSSIGSKFKGWYNSLKRVFKFGAGRQKRQKVKRLLTKSKFFKK